MAIAPGSLYTFRLPNGLHGACRVIRAPGVDEAQHAGSMLVGATPWVGVPADALRAPDAKKLVREHVAFVAGSPPASWKLAGVIAAKASAKRCMTSAPWAMFPNVVYARWRSEHEPDVVARDVAADRRASVAKIARLKASVTIDLEGLVPLATPKRDREPADVVRGFIAAMKHWEIESARIAKAHPAEVFELVAPAAKQIFAELCTPKDRGPQSFSSPSEFTQERIVATPVATARRVEIETERPKALVKTARYVLVKRDGAWLIDRRTPPL